jgi:hypothetical protein
MSVTTKTTGIFPSDIVIRNGLIAGLKNVRANPWLLDFVFAGVPQDALTAEEYGEADVQAMKAWFMKTKVPVLMGARVSSPPTFPCLVIGLASSAESKPTLGDVNYDPVEYNAEQPPLTAKFDPVSYDPATGAMVVPSFVSDSLVLTEGQLVVDAAGAQHQIVGVGDGDADIVLAKDLTCDFHNAYVVGALPGSATHLESLNFDETYVVGCYVQGEPWQLICLHSIVVFCLLAFKQSFLEGRGFEGSTVASSDLTRDNSFEIENVFRRVVTVAGRVRHFWPKGIFPTLSGADDGALQIIGGGVMEPVVGPDSSWYGDGDDLDALEGSVS